MSRSSVVDPTAVDASLHLLAHQVLEDLVEGDLEPSLLHVARRSDGISLGIKPLDGAHPTTYLLGFVAPEDWYALGVASNGYAHDMADRATGAPRRTRVHTVALVSRSGEFAHRTIAPDDPTLTRALASSADDPVGEQVDLLRLALELPTAPPPCGTDVYWTVQWLSSLLAADRPPSTWDDVAALHPAMTVLGDDPGDVPASEQLIETATTFARVCTWERMRTMAAQGSFPHPDLDGHDARWLDDGAFARFVLTRCAPLAVLRHQAAERIGGDLARRLESALGELDAPDESWPGSIHR